MIFEGPGETISIVCTSCTAPVFQMRHKIRSQINCLMGITLSNFTFTLVDIINVCLSSTIDLCNFELGDMEGM